MKSAKATFKTLAALVTVVSGLCAQAVPVTALPGSASYSFGNENYVGNGPRAVAPGITWTASNADSLFGWTGVYSFLGHGDWSSRSMIGLGDNFGSMTLSFSSSVLGVGAFMNYVPDPTPDGLARIAIYDSSMTMLESFTLDFSTNAPNAGEFHGFLRDSADIHFMTFSGGFIGAADLQVIANPVPEPSTYALFALGLVAVAIAARHRRKAQTVV